MVLLLDWEQYRFKNIQTNLVEINQFRGWKSNSRNINAGLNTGFITADLDRDTSVVFSYIQLLGVVT